MMEHHLDTQNAILLIRPKSSLETADFEGLASEIDPFIAETSPPHSPIPAPDQRSPEKQIPIRQTHDGGG